MEFGQFKIDSLKLRIPIDKIKIIDKTIDSKWYLLNGDTGEIEEDVYKSKAIKICKDGITTRFLKCKREFFCGRGAGRREEEFILILMNSKLLENKYFDGIRIETLKEIYEKLLSLKVIDFSLKSMLESFCSDVDICVDIDLNIIHQIELCKDIKSRARESSDENRFVKNFLNKNEVGFQCSSRKVATPSIPFIKGYGKYKEMVENKKNHKSVEFMEKYFLEDLEFMEKLESKFRLEWTIKGTETLRQFYNINEMTFANLLSIKRENHISALKKIMNKHLIPRTHKKSRIKKMIESKTPYQIIIMNLIGHIMKNYGVGFAEALTISLENIDCPVTKSRKKKELIELYRVEVKEERITVKSEKVDEFYDLVGL